MTFALDTTVGIGAILTVVIAIIGWVRAGRKAMDETISGLADRIDRHERWLTSVEQTTSGLPGKDNIHELRLELSGMAGDLREMRAVMQGNNKIMERLETIVSRHEDHLLDGRR